ncbi:MAG: tRNA glutamyl-Q(34) synthetase GluQRS [Hyphomicrobiales bacterium]|nr:tRNA glutamyl-Q(34) synthetase GluQRS [Hyphomicrobiales bacterium]
MSRPVFRFAPSPNGRLHLGHAFSAMLDHTLARAAGGRFLLRLEDVDVTRCRREWEDGIFEDLAWLGLDWDGEVRRQSAHFDAYAAALARLDAAGLLRPSHATRAEIRAAVARAEAEGRPWPRDPDGAPFPPDDDRHPRDDEPVARRLDMAAALSRVPPLDWREAGEGPMGETGRVAARPADWGDPVLARKETPSSYHLAVVVDDAAQGVTHVVRGRDLFWSTSVHRVLQTLLGLPAPVYLHHDLVRDATGRKLSKSAADTALASLRADGLTPADIRRLIGWGAVERRLDSLNESLTRSV